MTVICRDFTSTKTKTLLLKIAKKNKTFISVFKRQRVYRSPATACPSQQRCWDRGILITVKCVAAQRSLTVGVLNVRSLGSKSSRTAMVAVVSETAREFAEYMQMTVMRFQSLTRKHNIITLVTVTVTPSLCGSVTKLIKINKTDWLSLCGFSIWLI